MSEPTIGHNTAFAADKFSGKVSVFKYFCGICWRKIKRANGEDV